jgi:hypothetical protein
MKIVVAGLALLVLGVGGCTTAEPVYRGIYDGLQVRDELVYPAPGYRPMTEKRPGYWEYEAERKRLLDESPSK